MSLKLEHNGKQIPIADIEIKSSNEQVTLGNLERNLILKTLGKISIQVGNKYFDLNFNTDEQGNNFLDNIYTIKDYDSLDVNQYDNGSFVYDLSNNGLYFIYNKKILELASGKKSKLFLSFAEEQDLNGIEARRLVYNAKLRIKKIEEILSFTNNDVYENQVIFVEDQKQHYLLTNYNYPNILTNWIPLYLSINGGILYDGLTIYNKTKNYTLSLEGLHKENDNIYHGLRIGTDDNYIKTAALENGFIKTDFNGKGIILNRNNNTIFEYNQGKIGIGGKASRGDIDNIIYGTSKLTGNLFTNYNIMSDDFISRNITNWNGGKGYALKKTSIGTWFLEVDDLVVRNSISAEVLNLKELAVDRTYATGGHMMVTDGAEITSIEYIIDYSNDKISDLKHPLKESDLNGHLINGENYYFIYFNKKDEIPNENTGESSYDAGAFCPFLKDDILLCQSFKGLKTKKYYLTVSYSDNYRIAVNYNDLYNSYIIEDSERPSTDFETENTIDVKDELVRIGNQDPKRVSRQKVIDINGLKNWITMYDNLNSFEYAKDENGDFVLDNDGQKIVIDGPLTYKNLKLRIGDLAGLPDLGKGGTEVLPDDIGYGLYADNVYLKGKLVLWRKEDGVEYSEFLGINRGEWKPTEKYYLGDRVTYDGSYYYCNKVGENNYIINLNPNDYNEYWTLLVAKGANGSPGDSVNYVNITGLSYFKIDQLNNSDPTSISLTANLHNVELDPLLRTIRYQWICNSTIIKDITYSESFENHFTDSLNILYKGTNSNVVDPEIKEINWTPIWENANYNTFICNVFINGNISTEDQFTIYKIKDGGKGENGEPGESALSFILSNESISIPASYNGYIPANFIGANSKSEVNLRVFKGTKELIYSDNSEEDTFKFTLESEAINFFQKVNNKFYLIKGHYIDSSSLILPDGFIVTLKVNINNIIYDKKVSYSLSKAGQDANLIDWVKEWTGNSTEISSDGIISPKIYIGNKISKIDNKYIITDGIYLGRGLNEGEPSAFIGYKDGSRMFELTSEGRFFLGKQKTGATSSSIPIYTNGGLSFNGDKLIIGDDTSVGNSTLGNYITTIDNYGDKINKIVGDKYITISEIFNLKEIVTRIQQEYKDIETTLSGLLGISNVETLPSLSQNFNLYKNAYNNFNLVLNYYITTTPDENGFILVVDDKNLVISNTNYYSTLTSIKLEIENLRINRFDKNTTNVFRQEEQPTTRPGNSPLQVGDIWIKINSSNQELFSEIVVSVLNNVATWKFLGDNTGTIIDNGLISTGTIKLMDKNSLVDKAGITGSNSIGLFFNPNDLSQTSTTSNTINTEQSFIRFWAGLKDLNKNWNDAPFRVYENGSLFATAGKIGCLSINGYNFNVGGISTYTNIDTGNKENSLLRTKVGLTINENGDIIGQDFFLSGDSSKKSSIFVGKVYFIENGKLESAEDKINRLNLSLNEMFSLVAINNKTGEILDRIPEITDDYTIAIRANFGLFTHKFLSSRGMGPISGGGTGGLDEAKLWEVLGGNGIEQISKSHLTNALSGYVVDGDIRLTNARPASDVYAWAKAATKPSYAFQEISNIIVAGNEFNYINSGFDGDVHFNYRSLGQGTANINLYYFSNGNGARAGVVASSFIKAGGNSNQLLRADGGVSTFNWNGQSGQPTWIWGAFGQNNYDVWNPSNFNVYSAGVTRVSSDFDPTAIRTDLTFRVFDSYAKPGTPTTYGLVLDIAGISQHWQSQMWFDAEGRNVRYRGKAGYQNNSWGVWKTILDDSNWTSIVDGRYLPLTGGTLTGTVNSTAAINAAYLSSNGYIIIDGEGWFQNNKTGTGLYNSAQNARFRAQSGRWEADKQFYVNNDVVWNAGNDGAGSGLDADMLHGVTLSGLYIPCPVISYSGTVLDAKNRITNYFNGLSRSASIGQSCYTSTSVIDNWDNNSAATYDSSVYSFTKISGGYNGSDYGQWLLSSYADIHIGIVGKKVSNWTGIRWLAFKTDNVFTATTGFKSRNICIETDNTGADGGRSSEINNWNSNLYLQHASSMPLICNKGGGYAEFANKVIIDSNKLGGTPVISLAIGDSDTGFQWSNDGTIVLKANGVNSAYWNPTEFYAYNQLYGASVRAHSGYLFSTANGKTVQIGSQNSSYCHYSTEAGAHWFNTNVYVNGSIYPDGGGREIGDFYNPFGTIYVNDWFRSTGDNGWYSEKWNGGIYMTDGTWVRVYGSKRLLVNNVIRSAASTGTGCNGFGVSNQMIDGFEIYRGDNTFGIGVHDNDNIYFWRTLSGTVDSSAGKTYLCDIAIGSGQMNWYGVLHAGVGIYTEGYLSSKGQNTSDERLKTNIQDFNATDIIKKLEPKAYYWNNIAKNISYVFDDNIQYGLIAQWSNNIISGLVVENMFNDGYFGVRYEKLIPIILKGQKEQISKIETIEERVNRLELENIELKKQLKELKNVG